MDCEGRLYRFDISLYCTATCMQILPSLRVIANCSFMVITAVWNLNNLGSGEREENSLQTLVGYHESLVIPSSKP